MCGVFQSEKSGIRCCCFFFISNYNYDKNEYCGGFFLINDLVLQYTCSKTCNVRSNLERAWTYN